MDPASATRHVTVSGHPLAYHRAGGGAAVLMLHGITTYSFIWGGVFDRLRQGYDAIAVDLLGAGESEKPLGGDLSIRNQATLMEGLLAELGIGRVHVVGHDVGGGVAQILAVRRPDLVASLTLVNTVGYDYWPVQPILALRAPLLRQIAMAALDLGAFTTLIRWGVYHKDRVTPELMERFWMPLKEAGGREAFLHFARCLDNRHLMEIREELRALPMPVLIVRGDADVYLSSDISARLNREIPGSRLIRFPTGGHFIQLDLPGPLAETILAFLKTPGDPRGPLPLDAEDVRVVRSGSPEPED